MHELNVLVACGSGIVTSTIVMAKIAQEISQRGWDNVKLTQGSLSDVYAHTAQYDLIVTTTPIEAPAGERVLSALALLAGTDPSAFFKDFADCLSLTD